MLIIEFLQGLLGDRGIDFFLMVARLFGEASSILILSLYFWLVNPTQGRQLGLTLTLSMMSSVLLKDIFSLPRPYMVNPAVTTSEALLTNGNHSFPSGHAQGIMTIWGSIACFQKKLWVWIVAIALIFLVCLSRLVLGVHFPVDIIAGILLGIIWVSLGFWSNRDAENQNYQLSQKIIIWIAGGMGAIAFPQFAELLGVFCGFFAVNTVHHHVPRYMISKISLGVFGLVVITMLYVLTKKVSGILPDISIVDYCRYLLLTLSITEGVPTLWRGNQPVR